MLDVLRVHRATAGYPVSSTLDDACGFCFWVAGLRPAFFVSFSYRSRRSRENGGTGIGRYITALGTLGGQDAVYDPETNSLEPLSGFASYVGFQHWWKEGLR